MSSTDFRLNPPVSLEYVIKFNEELSTQLYKVQNQDAENIIPIHPPRFD